MPKDPACGNGLSRPAYARKKNTLTARSYSTNASTKQQEIVRRTEVLGSMIKPHKPESRAESWHQNRHLCSRQDGAASPFHQKRNTSTASIQTKKDQETESKAINTLARKAALSSAAEQLGSTPRTSRADELSRGWPPPPPPPPNLPLQLTERLGLDVEGEAIGEPMKCEAFLRTRGTEVGDELERHRGRSIFRFQRSSLRK